MSAPPPNDKPGLKDALVHVIQSEPGWAMFCIVIVFLAIACRIRGC